MAMPTKDFSKKREPISFTIDSDRFICVTAIPGDTLVTLLAKLQGADDDDMEQVANGLKQILAELLVDSSYARFAERFASKDDPIDFVQMNEIVEWLMEAFGMRPTKPSSDSPIGLPPQGSGMSLTGITPDVVSIPSNSQQTAS
jgi:hypothetical protein